jgi:hypothetical protein
MRNVNTRRAHGIWRAIAVAMASAFLLSLAFAGTASAAVPNKHKLFDEHFHYDGVTPCPESRDQWLNFNTSGNKDSPLDSNIKAWRVIIPADCYSAGATLASLDQNVPIENVKNLSFDWRNSTSATPGTAVGGSPRIVAFFDNGDALHMAAVDCRKDLSQSSFTWSRSDFTGFKSTDAPCVGYKDADSAQPYPNTPTMSVLQAYALAHPGRTMTYVFIVMDQAGTYYLDRIALGTQRLYGNGDLPMKTCTTEGSC